MAETPETTFGGARKAVTTLAGGCEMGDAIMALAQSEDPTELKVAEYALLLSPITAGIEDYLDVVTVNGDSPPLSPRSLIWMVGDKVSKPVLEKFETDPHKDVINDIARRRSRMVEYGAQIWPVSSAIVEASKLSVYASLQAAIASALVISEAQPQPRPRAEFIDAVKGSYGPVIARAVAHLMWNRALSGEFTRHAEDIILGTGENTHREDVAYDAASGRVHLAKPLKDWEITEPVAVGSETSGEPAHASDTRVSDIQTPDARIGCLISFDPDLAKRFYGHVVDMAEQHRSWPVPIAVDDTPLFEPAIPGLEHEPYI